MRNIQFQIMGLFCVLIILTATGCVAPPTESVNIIPKTTSPSVITSTTTPTPGPVYVTVVTPSVVDISTVQTQGYSEFAPQKPLLEDRSCKIFTTTQVFYYNGTAFTFDLKNPPMYITYSVVPSEVSIKKVATHSINKTEYLLEYDTFDPYSYLTIKVKSKTTGEIYLEDGFGTDYTSYTKRTLKVLNNDDLLIEIMGNKIKGTIDVWVKPNGNFDNFDTMTFDTCTYWGQTTRDNLPIALITSSPTPTWTFKEK